MLSSKKLIVAGIVAAFAAGANVAALESVALAADSMPSAASMMAAVPLTAASVKSFIASYPAVKAATDKLSAKYDVQSDDSSPANAWGAWMAAGGAWAELNGIVSAYGYSDFQTWLQTTISVATAYSFAKEGGAMDAGMSEAVAQIKNNPSLSEAQKKMMLDQMGAAATAIAAVRPPQGNLDAVTPYLDQLAKLFD